MLAKKYDQAQKHQCGSPNLTAKINCHCRVLGIGVGFWKFKRNREEGKIFFQSAGLGRALLAAREASDTPVDAASSDPPTAVAGAFSLTFNMLGIGPTVRFNRRVLSLRVLGSGSAGNCSLIATNQCRLLVDAGFSARQISKRLETIGVPPESLDGILITHEHSDHIAGLAIFCRRFGIPVYANSQTAEILRRGFLADFPKWNLFETGRAFPLKDIEIQSFYVPHDAVDPTAFVFTGNTGSIGVLTDLGYAPKLALERIRQVHTLVIETNHDERMLQEDTKRPWSVKQRILSRHGHLSNEAAAKLVATIAGDQLRCVVLGHLSRDCNRPEIALETMRRYGIEGIELFCAEQNRVSPLFAVTQALSSAVGNKVDPVQRHGGEYEHTQTTFDLSWQAG